MLDLPRDFSVTLRQSREFIFFYRLGGGHTGLYNCYGSGDRAGCSFYRAATWNAPIARVSHLFQWDK